MINTDVININNNKYLISCPQDLIPVVEQVCGYEVANILRHYIKQLQEEADYTSKKLDTDLEAYESDLDSYNSMCCEIIEMIESLIIYIVVRGDTA